VIDVEPIIKSEFERMIPRTRSVPDWNEILRRASEWERVPTNADPVWQAPPRRSRNRRLALLMAAVAALTAALALVPALAGQGYFWFLDFDAPKPTTPVVTVTSFTDSSGTTWQLTAYQSEHNDLCYQLTPDTNTATGAGACSEIMPINSLILSNGVAHTALVAGPVTADAKRVTLVGADGEAEATVATAPDALQTEIKFYIAQLPAGMTDAPITIKALDAQDHTIASWAIPARSKP
jgi:hypothetical protein